MTVGPNDARPLRAQIAEDIELRIADGTYKVGDKLPSLRTLSRQYDVAEPTVHAAIRDLQQAGAVESTTGRGTFIRERPAVEHSLEVQLAELRERMDGLADRVAQLEATSDCNGEEGRR